MTQGSYRRSIAHVLVEGHDRATCTACAYAAGRREVSVHLVRALRHVYACPVEPFACPHPDHELATDLVTAIDQRHPRLGDDST